MNSLNLSCVLQERPDLMSTDGKTVWCNSMQQQLFGKVNMEELMGSDKGWSILNLLVIDGLRQKDVY